MFAAQHGRRHAPYKQKSCVLNKSKVLQLICFVFDGFLTQSILEQDKWCRHDVVTRRVRVTADA